jgi:hypothetical protein
MVGRRRGCRVHGGFRVQGCVGRAIGRQHVLGHKPDLPARKHCAGGAQASRDAC